MPLIDEQNEAEVQKMRTHLILLESANQQIMDLIKAYDELFKPLREHLQEAQQRLDPKSEKDSSNLVTSPQALENALVASIASKKKPPKEQKDNKLHLISFLVNKKISQATLWHQLQNKVQL